MLKKRVITAIAAAVFTLAPSKIKAEDSLSFKIDGGVSFGSSSSESININNHYNGSLSLDEEIQISSKVKSNVSILSYNDFKNLDSAVLTTSTEVDFRHPIKEEVLDVDFLSNQTSIKNRLLSASFDICYFLDTDKSAGFNFTIARQITSSRNERNIDGSSTRRISILDPENLNEYIETSVIQLNEDTNTIVSRKQNNNSLIPSIFYRNNNYGIELILKRNDDDNRNLRSGIDSGTEILSERDGTILVSDFTSSYGDLSRSDTRFSDLHFLTYYDYKEKDKFKLGAKALVDDDVDFAVRGQVDKVRDYSFFGQFNTLMNSFYFGVLERRNPRLFDFLKQREFLDPRNFEAGNEFLEELNLLQMLSSYKGFFAGVEYFGYGVKEPFAYDLGYCGQHNGLITRINRGDDNYSILFLFNKDMALNIKIGKEVSLGIVGTIDRN